MPLMDKSPQSTASLRPATEASTPPVDLTGRTLGDYHILRRLGQGGMGQVYLAEQVSLKRKVALKLLKPELAANPTSLQRFKAEAEAVARATHANIVQVYAIGDLSGLSFMALEYVEGRNLHDFVARKGPPEVLLALSIMRQVAAALQRASELGIIHRDIKPENILLTRKGEVKVADFGLSRCLDGDKPALNLTASGVTMGTPLYMSPEQVEGRPVDCRTDIYSFGATAYCMMAGHPPFEGTSAFEVALKHVKEEPRPLASIRPDLPETLCAIIHKMMAKDPQRRYQTGRDLTRDLVRLRESLSGQTTTLPAQSVSVELVPISSSNPSVSVPSTREPRAVRRWLPYLVAGSILLAALAGAAFGWLRRQASARPAGLASPADQAAVEPLLPLQQRERALHDAAEQYLTTTGTNQNAVTGLGVCLDLVLFYLENDRLDEAEVFFKRLEAVKNKWYVTLGRLGQAIVLALKSKPHPSSELFHEVFKKRLTFPEPAKNPAKNPEPKRVVRNEPELQVFLNPRLLHWIKEAVYYNEKNGVTDKEWLPARVRNQMNALRP